MYYIENLPSKYSIDELHSIIDWAFIELDIREHVNVVFEFVRLPIHTGAEVYDEEFDVDNDEEHWFRVEINKPVLIDIRKIIFHELVHVKQISEGKLRYEKFIPYWNNEKHDSIDYKNRPWEIEAYTMESQLFEKYCV